MNYKKDRFESHFTHAFPVFIHSDYLLGDKDKKINAFIGAKAGYSIINENDDIILDSSGTGKSEKRGGFFVSPSFGIKYNLSEKRKIVFSLSFDYQEVKRKYYSSDKENISNETRGEGFFSFRIGYEI